MRRLTSISSSNLWLGIAVVLGALTAGCASGPRPKILDDASAMLTHRDATELEGLKPKLISEANAYLRKAVAAHERGDEQEAALFAQLAISRFNTAKNLVEAVSARRLAKQISRQTGRAASESERLRLQQLELKRFQSLEQRIAAIHEELSKRPSEPPEATDAKRALAKARRQQAAAIGAGAPAAAPTTYQQGASLVGSAVESLELGIYGESRQSSAQALVAFERAIAEAGAPKPDAAPEVDPNAAPRAKAEDALSDAASAQALAMAAGAPSSNPGLYQQGSLLLGSAERRFDRDDFRGAVRLAQQARDAFTAASAPPTASDVAASSANPAARASTDPRSVDQMIVALRFKRAELIGARKHETCDATFKEFEAILELAADRLRAGDRAQAREFAIRAEERVRRCEQPPAQAAPPPSAAATTGPDPKEALEKQRATAAIQKAQRELALAKTRYAGDARLAQPTALVTNAEKWFDRGAYAQAEQFADQAVLALATIGAVAPVEPKPAKADDAADPVKEDAAKALQRAQQLHAKLLVDLGDDPRLRAPERHLSSAERWFDRGRFAQAKVDATKAVELFAKLEADVAKEKASAKAPPIETLSAEGRRAQKSIADAKDARVRAVVALASDAQLATPDRLVGLADKAFEDMSYKGATLYAEKARQQYLKLAKGEAAPPPAATPDDAPSLAALCVNAGKQVTLAERLAKRTGGKHLSAAEKRQHQTGASLATVARARFRAGECDQALALADEAVDALSPLPLADGGSAAEAPPRKPGRTPGRTPDKVDSGHWQSAYDKTIAALEKRDEAEQVLTDAMRPTFERGQKALARGRRAYDRDRFATASREAEVAIAQFEAVIAAGSREPAVAKRPGAPPKAPAPAAAPTAPDAPDAVPKSPTKRPAGEPTWVDPYRVVYRALKLRAQAAARAKTDADKAALERGKKHLSKAEIAWTEKNFEGAAELARSAIREFRQVIDKKAKPPAADPPKPTEAVTLADADAAVREAKVLLQLCERDKCAERDFEELTRAKEMVASAEQSLATQKLELAKKLADDAKDKLKAILAKPRPKATAPVVDPAKKKAAEDAIKEAQIAEKLCEARKCNTINLEGLLRAQQDLAAAGSALADGDPDRAKRLADQSHVAFGAIQPAAPNKPTFAIPAGVAVTRSGSQLYVTPAVEFATGSARIAASSRSSIDDLAKTLKANASQLKSVRITGYTDNRGSKGFNKGLSAQRAATVLRALVAGGVDKAVLSSEGRGDESPIADNNTAEGRTANRRVEIHIELK